MSKRGGWEVGTLARRIVSKHEKINHVRIWPDLIPSLRTNTCSYLKGWVGVGVELGQEGHLGGIGHHDVVVHTCARSLLLLLLLLLSASAEPRE